MQTTRQVANEATGYAGPLADGHWLYAATLQAGDRLLNADGTWAEVLGAEAVDEPLLAYNLTVEGFHTYFVAANEDAAPVWVHNANCFEVSRIRAEAGYIGSKKHGVRWSDQDAIARAIKENKPQGRFGSVAEIDYITDQVRLLGAETGRITAGIKTPIPLPSGWTCRGIVPLL